MKSELETIQLQASFLIASLSQIKAKYDHKTRRKSSSSDNSLPVITSAQQKNIRSVLTNESESIMEIVNQVKDLKLQIGL
ncbi:hypothetical protein AC249_AIPGENE26986 [Exaiptasia diaphana]|nr:hypothetical protein AC249_AIPGENE26986 [Exaiptasia diaphana]